MRVHGSGSQGDFGIDILTAGLSDAQYNYDFQRMEGDRMEFSGSEKIRWYKTVPAGSHKIPLKRTDKI